MRNLPHRKGRKTFQANRKVRETARERARERERLAEKTRYRSQIMKCHENQIQSKACILESARDGKATETSEQGRAMVRLTC